MVKNKIDFLARRASAEGFNTNAVKAVLKKLETKLREEAVAAARRGWSGFQPITVEKMVWVLTATRYEGGYNYPGSVITPGNFQALEWSGGSQDPDPVGAREWLDAAPIGTEVMERYDAGNGSSCEVYKKTREGWGCIRSYDESEVAFAEKCCYLYNNEAAVAATLGVAVSPTFRAVYHEVAGQLYYEL